MFKKDSNSISAFLYAVILLSCVCSAFISVTLAVPATMNFQGKINVSEVPFTGTGNFRFALLDGSFTPLWTNDGEFPEPLTDVVVDVSNGLYNIILGDAPMAPIPVSIFTEDEIYLRIWFDDGSVGLEQLSPDHRLTSVGFAFQAEKANTAENAANAELLDGHTWSELEESDEIDADILTHAAQADAHHAKTTSFSELTDAAVDTQIPDDISIDNGRLYAPAGSGKVGIGTTDPSSKLDVSGTVSANKYTSTVDVGTAPLTVTSTTKVVNLNADMMDGKHLSDLDNRFVKEGQSNSITSAMITNNTIDERDLGFMRWGDWCGNGDIIAEIGNYLRVSIGPTKNEIQLENLGGSYSIGYVMIKIDSSGNVSASDGAILDGETASKNFASARDFTIHCYFFENSTYFTFNGFFPYYLGGDPGITGRWAYFNNNAYSKK